MGKAILVIDMPKCCNECPICVSWEVVPAVEEYYCAVKNNDVDRRNKPSWCPLKPAPEEQEVWYDDPKSDWERGYNNCVREIIGREEDYE